MAMKATRFLRALPILAVLGTAIAVSAPKPAQARIGIGFFVAPPVVVVPPVYDYYYPAPVYYAPPVYYYPPPGAAPVPAGYGCYAGLYVCPLETIHPVGGHRARPAYGGSSVAGTVR
jgi:hypothetical protein